MTPVWYLIQYDIRSPKRLQRVHRLLKSCAFPLQESVFAWCGTHQELNRLKQQLQQRINEQEDDIRGYRILQPLQLYGQNPFMEDSYSTAYPPHRHTPITPQNNEEQVTADTS